MINLFMGSSNVKVYNWLDAPHLVQARNHESEVTGDHMEGREIFLTQIARDDDTYTNTAQCTMRTRA